MPKPVTYKPWNDRASCQQEPMKIEVLKSFMTTEAWDEVVYFLLFRNLSYIKWTKTSLRNMVSNDGLDSLVDKENSRTIFINEL